MRAFCPDTGDVLEYRSDDEARARDIARQYSEDLEDVQFEDGNGRGKLGIVAAN